MFSSTPAIRIRSLRRPVQSILGCIAMVLMMGASDASRFERLGHGMMCICSCSQILLECNHVGCPDSARMIGELHEQIASGVGDTAVLNWFAAKYGAIVLASPIRGGFDNVAWIAPIAVFLLATIGTAALVWVWKQRSSRMIVAGARNAAAPAADAALRERIRRETEY